MKTVSTLAIMLLPPPVVFFGLAHAFPGSGSLLVALMIPLAAIGLAAVANSSWPKPVRIGVGTAYGLASIAALPLLVLLAVCSTGDCL